MFDMAPTLIDFAEAEIPDTMDGASLLSIIEVGSDTERTVFGEYLGEGAVAPILMIRRGDHTFVWCEADPPQLCDLAADPTELTNLAEQPEHADLVAASEREVHECWDPGALRQTVLAEQRARADVDRAVRQGRYTSWDYQPMVDARDQSMRNHLDLDDVERGRRI